MFETNGVAYTTLKEAKQNANGGVITHKLEVEPVENALQAVNTTMKWIALAYPDATASCFLSGKGNYRDDVATIKKYKGNRSPFAKPRHYGAIREHLIKIFDAQIVEGMEADDEIGIQSTELAQQGQCPIIVSTDKDLDMIPGLHYNWVNKEEYNVNEEDAYRNFFRQLLTGDTVDNVPGIEGVGPVGAGKVLASSRGPSAMLHAVRETYEDHYPNGREREDGSKLSAGDAMLEAGRLLWIKRDRSSELWNFRTIKD